MNMLNAVLLGIIQGITEFLPVSSSGHLALFQQIFGITEPTLTFDVVLHVGTLIPVVIVFWEEIFSLIRKPFQKLTYCLVVATLPIVVISLLFNDIIDTLFIGGRFLAIGFMITGFVLMFADRVTDGEKKEGDITFADSVLIGCMQAIAIVPAISRSGCTISGALSRRLSRDTAARFSFLLSIPAILGAAVLQVKDIVSGELIFSARDAMPMLMGFLAAALSGYLSIRFMLKVIRACKLKYFSYYVFALAAFILADQFFLHIFF